MLTSQWATLCLNFILGYFMSLWIKPTDALNSNFIGIMTLHVSGSISAHHQEFLAVHLLWYILCGCDRLPHKMYHSRCTAKNSWWWAERLPKRCRVIIPIKLEFSASVGFIHKESVTMHGHTIVKKMLFYGLFYTYYDVQWWCYRIDMFYILWVITLFWIWQTQNNWIELNWIDVQKAYDLV